MGKFAVVALGGNALLRKGEKGTIEQQEYHVKKSIENLLFLIDEGYNLILTHGNGPQVGNILLRSDAGQKVYGIPPIPLDVCVAYSQGGIGYIIERILRNVLKKHNIKKEVISVISHCIVNKDDEAFLHPEKRIGKIYTKNEKDKLQQMNKSWEFKKVIEKENAWRRVVASPAPIDILNYKTIKELALQGKIVIAIGGGGIPVYYDAKNSLRTIDAVVDKDLASALLASQVVADELYILTNVPYIYKNFNKPIREKLEFLDYADAKDYLQNGEFSEGGMKPKIIACLNFIKAGGKKAIITESSKLEDQKFGSKITMHYDN